MNTRIFLFLSFFYSLIQAETYYVPEDFDTIQDAIVAVNNSDSIIVNPGFYPEQINFLGKAITVTSRYLIDNDSLIVGTTIIDAQEEGSVVTFSSGETFESTLQGFTLQNGTGNNEDPDGNGSYYPYGGGVYCENSSPTIKGCIIQGNIANQGGGGGIFCYNSSPIIEECHINSNETDDVGGGLYARDGSSPQVFHCTFYDNTADYGGGCYLRNESNPVIQNTVFNQNSANNTGGGIFLKDDVSLQASQVHIIFNDAEGLGGGLYVNNAETNLLYCLIADNQGSSGGGAYFRNNSSGNMTNTTLANNSAESNGNGIYMRDGSTLALLNTIVWDNNSSQEGGQIYFRSEGNESQLEINYSIIQNGQSGVITNNNGSLIWGNGNFETEPYFCGVGNYYVRENSPCLDSGQDGDLIGCFQSGCGPVNLGPVWYVDLSGDNSNDGSLATPFETIAKAMASASDGDTIRLTPGVYTESIDFSDKEVVLESMTFELNDSNVVLETYFVPGGMGGACLTLNGSSNDHGTIRGISFRGGSSQNGGGILIVDCSPVLSDLVVEDNSADNGGGIFLSGSDATLKNIIIRNNGANLGGGVYVDQGSPSFENVTFQENIAYRGGASYFENATPSMFYCMISQNEAFIEGGGIYQNGGQSTIEWTSFERNNGYDYGGSVVSYQASMNFDQITFSDNTSGFGSMIALYSSAIIIKNSILWGNNGPLLYAPESDGVTYFNLSYSDIEGGQELFNDYPNIILSSDGGIFNEDPEFCSPSEQLYELRESSICRTSSDSLGIIGSYDGTCNILSVNQNIPTEFALFNNFPNPFNPNTCIRYSLDEYATYSIKIFDINGSLVRTLKQGYGTPGQHVVFWDSSNNIGDKVSSGVYFYQLSTEKEIVTKRMVLMK